MPRLLVALFGEEQRGFGLPKVNMLSSHMVDYAVEAHTYSLALAYQGTSAVWRLAGRLPSRLLQNTRWH
jgi:hypothetical protein